MIYMVWGPMSGLTKGFTRGNGKRIKCMVKDRSLGLMEENILE